MAGGAVGARAALSERGAAGEVVLRSTAAVALPPLRISLALPHPALPVPPHPPRRTG